MFTYKLGNWTLEFTQKYRIVQDNDTAVVIDDERTALVLLSIGNEGNIRIERTYYAMICEISSTEHKVTFHTVDE